jgi:hypothetical protein
VGRAATPAGGGATFASVLAGHRAAQQQRQPQQQRPTGGEFCNGSAIHLSFAAPVPVDSFAGVSRRLGGRVEGGGDPNPSPNPSPNPNPNPSPSGPGPGPGPSFSFSPSADGSRTPDEFLAPCGRASARPPSANTYGRRSPLSPSSAVTLPPPADAVAPTALFRSPENQRAASPASAEPLEACYGCGQRFRAVELLWLHEMACLAVQNADAGSAASDDLEFSSDSDQPG